MSGVGTCYDIAPMESFIGTLRTECATSPFATRAEARVVIFDYIEIWYNRQRLIPRWVISARWRLNVTSTKQKLSVRTGQGQPIRYVLEDIEE
jgi:transposase InsO family protein